MLWGRCRETSGCPAEIGQKRQRSHALVCGNTALLGDLSASLNPWKNNPGDVPCFAVLCRRKESARDGVGNGKTITRPLGKMPVMFLVFFTFITSAGSCSTLHVAGIL